MGRRKKAQKVVKKKVVRGVSTIFKCLFCNHEKSVSCKLNMNSMIGELVCRICDAKFETQINSLTDPIDVFSEWLDEAHDLQEGEYRKQVSGLPSVATGYVGDGHDYVDDGQGDMGEGDDASVVGSDADAAGEEGQGEGDGDGEEGDGRNNSEEGASAPTKAGSAAAPAKDADDDLFGDD
jgi:transcription elongation factor Elf1